MLGNVWEWTSTWFAKSSGQRVLRGARSPVGRAPRAARGPPRAPQRAASVRPRVSLALERDSVCHRRLVPRLARRRVQPHGDREHAHGQHRGLFRRQHGAPAEAPRSAPFLVDPPRGRLRRAFGAPRPFRAAPSTSRRGTSTTRARRSGRPQARARPTPHARVPPPPPGSHRTRAPHSRGAHTLTHSPFPAAPQASETR